MRTAQVVEDEPLLRMEVVDLLEDEGYAVVEAKGAAQALERLAARPGVALMVTDVSMPGAMDGLALVRRVARDHPAVAVVVVSAHVVTASGDLPEGVPFVARPFLERQLLAAIRAQGGRDPKP